MGASNKNSGLHLQTQSTALQTAAIGFAADLKLHYLGDNTIGQYYNFQTYSHAGPALRNSLRNGCNCWACKTISGGKHSGLSTR